jgi:glycosyltransferase involved in cell wall biosynthesis
MLSRGIPIVVAAPPMRTGGTEQHLLHVLPALSRRGFDITAVLLESGGALEAALRERITRVVTPSLKLSRPLRTLEQARLIRSAVRQSGSVVVHAFLSEPYIAAAIATISVPSRRPTLIYGRRSLSFYARKHRLGKRLEIAAHRLSGALVGNSQAVVDELATEADDGSKLCKITNGIPLGAPVELSERAAARRQFGIPDDAFVLTLVANFHTYKGHADLIAALGICKDRMPKNWRVVLAGRDGGAQAALVRQIQSLDLADHVIMPGEWPGSREPYAAADGGLLVSHTEGFSNSLIEGMAAGLPMIATRVGGNVDAIIDGVDGFLVGSQAPEELASAILTLAQMPDLRARLGAAARDKAVHQFSLETCVDRYERLWRGFAEGWVGQPQEWLERGQSVSMA